MYARRLYRKPVKFDVEERSTETGSITFVDKEVLATWDDVQVIRKDPNKRYVAGLDSAPVKIRYPQFLGKSFIRPR